MSHFKLMDKLGINIEETKETVELYHKYGHENTDTITKWWVSAHDVESVLRDVFADDPATFKNREYVRKLEAENRDLKGIVKQIKRLIKDSK